MSIRNEGFIIGERNQLQGIKPKTRERKLRSGKKIEKGR